MKNIGKLAYFDSLIHVWTCTFSGCCSTFSTPISHCIRTASGWVEFPPNRTNKLTDCPNVSKTKVYSLNYIPYPSWLANQICLIIVLLNLRDPHKRRIFLVILNFFIQITTSNEPNIFLNELYNRVFDMFWLFHSKGDDRGAEKSNSKLSFKLALAISSSSHMTH